MRVKAKTSFATRTCGYSVGQIYEVSDEEYKGIAPLVSVVGKEDKKETKAEVVEEVANATEKPKKKGK